MINKKKATVIFLLSVLIPFITIISSFFGYSVSLFSKLNLSVIASVIWILAAFTAALFYLLIKSKKSKPLKITGLIISSVFSVILIIFSAILILISQSAKNTVIDRIISPESTLFAEIVNADQGALGGNTVVYIKGMHKTDFILFSIRKNKRIYVGEWKENPKIKWKDENCLIINSKEFDVN